MANRIVVTFVADSTSETFEQARVTIGRSSDNDIVIDADRHPMVSGHHADVALEGDAVTVNDLGSTNGTFVNKKQVKGATPLGADDVLRLGQGGPEFKITVEREAPSDATPTRVEQKKFIGETTLFRAIGTATKKTRSKMNRRFFLIFLIVVVAGAAGVYLYRERERKLTDEQASIRKDHQQIEKDVAEAREVMAEVRSQTDSALREELDAHKKELDALKGKLGEGESRIAQLVVEIQERDKALDAIKRRQDLSEEQRKALIAETEQKVKALADELSRTEEQLRAAAKGGGGGVDWASIVARNEKAIFLMLSRWTKEGKQSIGTAFGLRANGLLATNAHVVKSIESADINLAVQNLTGRIFVVKRQMAHPGWTRTNGPDVGLVEIDTEGASIPALELASDADLRRLRIGTQLGTLGYPGELYGIYLSKVDEERGIVKTALATFKDGWIGRITDYDGAAADAAQARYIQHSASLSGGTSGSPMFGADGKVVAINHAGMDYVVKVRTPDAAGSGEVQTPSAAEIGYAIRADELRGLLTRSGW
ncbi:MAG: FHA domain-containing protein [Planctomycetota bacterium]|jgi:pSer/pThr/pTyr-binding forkhead associated (FHA) protein/S1-C subfamily serine protease